MAIIGRLRILETLSRGRIESYRALDPFDNVTMLLHYGDAHLFDIADDLGDDVLEWGDAGNKQYILTRDIPDYENLNLRPPLPPGAGEALERAGRWPLTRTNPSKCDRRDIIKRKEEVHENVMNTDDSPEPKDQPGEFTRMFRAVPKPDEPENISAPVKQAAPTGEFTQMFSTSAKPEESSAAPGAPATAAPEATPAKVSDKQPQRPERASQARTPAGKPEPGEFTRMFRTSTELSPGVPPPPAPVSEPAPQAPAEKKPSDFTRMFSAVPTLRPTAPEPAQEKPVAEPGSFTQFFREPAAKPVALPSPPAASPTRPPVVSGRESEFTKFFKDPLPSAGREVNWKSIENQPAPLAASKAAGEFTRMFGRSERVSPGQAPGSGGKESATNLFPSSKPALAPKDTTGQVDDFAKIFAQSSAVSEPKPPAATAPQAQPASAPMKPVIPAVAKPAGPPVLVLIVIITAVLVLAGCALYYFVFRK
ncbi:MAG: hypothetical protein M3Y57_10910 [Acidobacteriota bacterium]|nr:hypothetical protein [Acidobacteriota bacterium]